MELYLKHTPQPWPWGCQYYSLYSLLGDERILDDVTEANGLRFDECMRALGYFFSPLYCEASCTVPMPEAAWLTLFGGAIGVEALQGHIGPFLAGVRSLRNRKVMHMVGIALRGVSETGLAVQVFDPCAAGEKEYATLADFLVSPYGQVYELRQVLLLVHFDQVVPTTFGPDAPHVHPEVRQAWEATQLQMEAA